MCVKQKTIFVMNLKTNEIFTVDNWSVSDNVLRVRNDEYLPTEFVWFYSREDAEKFIKEKKNFNRVEVHNFTEYGTTVRFEKDDKVTYRYYGTPIAWCEHCDRFLVDDEIHYMNNDQRSEVCEDCYENCEWCGICGRVIDEEEASRYDGYCSNCY